MMMITQGMKKIIDDALTANFYLYTAAEEAVEALERKMAEVTIEGTNPKETCEATKASIEEAKAAVDKLCKNFMKVSAEREQYFDLPF